MNSRSHRIADPHSPSTTARRNAAQDVTNGLFRADIELINTELIVRPSQMTVAGVPLPFKWA